MLVLLYGLALGLVLGAASLNVLPALPSLLTLLLLALALLLMAAVIRRSFCWGLSLGVIFGLGLAVQTAHRILAWELDPHQHGLVLVEGEVLRANPIEVLVEMLDNQQINPAIRIRLFWAKPSEKIIEGMQLRAYAKLKSPMGLANPGTYDRERQLFLQEIRALGTIKVDKEHPLQLIAKPASWLTRYRNALRNFLEKTVPPKQVGIVVALVLGDKHLIDPSVWRTWQMTGTAHLLAISGLHVGGVAACCWAIGRRHRAGALCLSAFGALLYSLVAGLNVSTLRACVMVLLIIAAKLFCKKISTLTVFCVALIVVILLDPLAPMKMAFWLSFSAVGILLLAHQGPTVSWVIRSLWPQWAIFIGLLPLSIAMFAQVPLFSPLANLLAIPWVSFLVVPPVLMAAVLFQVLPTVACGLLAIAALALKGVSVLLQLLASAPWATWEVARPAWVIALALLGVLASLLPAVPGKKFAWQCCLPLLFWAPTKPQLGQVWITLLDVGQGLAAVVETAKHQLVIDFGPRFSNTQDAGEQVLLPFLKERGIHRLSMGIVSHGDLDHRGGLASLLRSMPILELYSSEPQRVIEAQTKPCHAGITWVWDGVQFAFLHPQEEAIYRGSNDRSCVLKITNGEHSVLFAGDIEKKAEQALLEQNPSALAASVLVVPHHGSRSSSSEQWVAAVDPDFAVISVGCNNVYRLPHPAIVQRYEAVAKVLLTSVAGAIQFQLAQGQMVEPSCFRTLKRRFWHANRREERCGYNIYNRSK